MIGWQGSTTCKPEEVSRLGWNAGGESGFLDWLMLGMRFGMSNYK